MHCRHRRLQFDRLEDRRLLAVFTVNQLGDSGAGSLRDAILQANAAGGADTIEFSVSGVIHLLSQLPTVTDDLTIDGPGSGNLTIDAGGGTSPAEGDGWRIFHIDDGQFKNDIEVEINGLTLTGGDPVFESLVAEGGAIRNDENLTLRDCTLIRNDARTGGAIYNDGTLTVIDCVFSRNTATSRGGAIVNTNTATITGSTLSRNTASGAGGGILNEGNLSVVGSTLSRNSAEDGGGINNDGTLTITNSTISGNTADFAGGGMYSEGAATITSSTITNNTSSYGGGLYTTGTATVTNSIVAGNTSTDSSFENLLGSLSGTSGFNLIDVNPRLGPLGNHGGPTQTHPLLPDSMALDAGDPSVGANPGQFDQRGSGYVRVANGGSSLRIDIGAYEAQGAPAYPTGDYNHDGIANIADYTKWRDTLGSTTNLAADGNSSDAIDTGDYTVWRMNFGNTQIPMGGALEVATAIAVSDAAFAEYETPDQYATNVADEVDAGDGLLLFDQVEREASGEAVRGTDDLELAAPAGESVNGEDDANRAILLEADWLEM